MPLSFVVCAWFIILFFVFFVVLEFGPGRVGDCTSKVIQLLAVCVEGAQFGLNGR